MPLPSTEIVRSYLVFGLLVPVSDVWTVLGVVVETVEVIGEVMGVVMEDKGVSREVYGCDDRELEPSCELDVTGTLRVSFEDCG